MRELADAVVDAIKPDFEVRIRSTVLSGHGRAIALAVEVRKQGLTATRIVFLDAVVPSERGTVLAVEVDDAAEELKNALARKDRSTPSTSAR